MATGGGSIEADFVIGADGATSITARTAGLVDASRVLWGFAVRGYIEADVTRPVIALWNEQPRRGFPGYGWLFPGPDGANLGLGLGLGHTRGHGHRAQQQLDEFRSHLVRIGVLESESGSALRAIRDDDRATAENRTAAPDCRRGCGGGSRRRASIR